eukprot:CAMPEP_0181172892 /NCGR_PEP_ID=MMETSP1096-20121128/2696_1 /TAXON_ID=156174 ORGANISM="Chrysochromulina ericina, Strain CCMP281" /NCGR_SAMPLE_ID=MMETSP1096 /ASSEMBLY_ACC=CAM_ASM_000453 /LENGTH=72 /DNA_ID=CAMNT_0023260659 /DNA_START=820 /DNA_END=1038 /DNA_ORIENTATION=-
MVTAPLAVPPIRHIQVDELICALRRSQGLLMPLGDPAVLLELLEDQTVVQHPCLKRPFARRDKLAELGANGG